MNIKHHLKRRVRDTEAALAPLIARLTSEGVNTRLLSGQNGNFGIVKLVMLAPSAPEIAESFVATVIHDLAALGLCADQEISPIPGDADHVGVVFRMTLKLPTAPH